MSDVVTRDMATYCLDILRQHFPILDSPDETIVSAMRKLEGKKFMFYPGRWSKGGVARMFRGTVTSPSFLWNRENEVKPDFEMGFQLNVCGAGEVFALIPHKDNQWYARSTHGRGHLDVLGIVEFLG